MSELIISETGKLMRAELDVQISTAKAYPRDQASFIKKAIELATMDEETAESCIYCLVRGKGADRSEIKGNSIRLAEIAAACWGNIHAASRIVENDGKFITAEGVAWDLENNVKMSSVVRVRITYKDGKTYNDDMQGVAGAAACAKALRNAIFKVVPKALVDRVYDAAVKFAVGDQKTMGARRKSVFERLKKLGIDEKKIFEFFNKNKIEDFDAKEIEQLIGIGTAIKDGMLSIDNAFSLTEELLGLNVEDRIKSALKTKIDPKTGEINGV